jgi:hypothetical protein
VITYLKDQRIIVKDSDEAKHRLLVVNLQNVGTNSMSSMRTEVCTCASGFHVTQLSVANSSVGNFIVTISVADTKLI